MERISSPVLSYSLVRGFRALRCLRVLDRATGFEMRASHSRQEGARREHVDPNYTQIRQQTIVVGD